MKRGLYLLFLVILIPTVSALELQNIDKNLFNLGDEIEVKGITDNSFKGGLRVNLNCGSVYSLLFKNVNFNGSSEFKENVKIYNGEGECNIAVLLETKDGVIDQKESNKFTVTKNLNSSFSVDKNAVAKGEPLSFRGSVKTSSGNNFNGLATIEILGPNNKEVFTLNADNEWSFNFDTVNHPIGDYVVTVNYQDLYGNSGKFENAVKFKLTSRINLIINSDKKEYLPGDKISLTGILQDFKGAAQSGKVKVFYDGKLTPIAVVNGDFKFELNTETNQAAGNYSLDFKFEDEFGNFGEDRYTYFVKSVPKRILLSLSKNEFLPKEEVNAKTQVVDQTGNEITKDKDVTIKVYNPNKEVITEWKNELNYDLDEYAMPGRYIIDAQLDSLTEEQPFDVKPVELLEISLINESLLLFNKGNVVYNKPLEIVFNGVQERRFIEEVNLKPGESEEYKLNDKLTAGTYTITVLSGDNAYKFENLALSDDRSVIKKTGNMLTGAVGAIGGLGVTDLGDTAKVILAIVIILAIGFYIAIKRQTKLLKQLGWYIKNLFETHIKQNESIDRLKKVVKTKHKENKKVLNILNRYLDPHVARELISKDKMNFDSEKREISVMFTDIRDFTKLVYEGDPWVIVNLVNHYFKTVTDIIYQYHGTINKYIGDAVMALFNAPRKVENHLLYALKAGVEISKEVDKLNLKLKERGLPTISVGVGVSSGYALIGSFGDKFMEYSALGNCVNLASRLQSFSTGNNVLIDEETYSKVKDKVDVVEFGVFDLKGIGRMKVYSVVNVKTI